MKGKQNVEIVVIWSKVTQGHWQCRHSKEHDFLIDFNRNYASISYHFRFIMSYLPKADNFNLPHLHLATLLGVTV